MLKALLALIAAALFAGGALYASWVGPGIPARPGDPLPASRATALQAALALLSLALGLWAWWKLGDAWLLAGALLVGAAVAFTLLARRGLHLLPALLGLAAVAAYFAAFVRP